VHRAASVRSKTYPAIETLELRMYGAHRFHGRTSKMSHDDSRRGACRRTISSRLFHSENCDIARDVTDVGVGSGDWLGDRTLEATPKMKGGALRPKTRNA
jgi:hypothetical protein